MAVRTAANGETCVFGLFEREGHVMEHNSNGNDSSNSNSDESKRSVIVKCRDCQLLTFFLDDFLMN